jgi:PAS domain S-box-containing protein
MSSEQALPPKLAKAYQQLEKARARVSALEAELSFNAPVRQHTPLSPNNDDYYYTLLEQASDAIFLADETGQLILVNRRTSQLLGYSRDELLARRVSDFVVPEDLVVLPGRFQELRDGNSVLTPRTLIRKDGTRIQVEINAKMLADGTYQGIIRDLSERKLAEEALRESEERFRIIFAQAAVGMALVSPDGHFLVVNKRLCDLVGYTQDELLTKRFQDITHPDDSPNDIENVRQILAREIDTYSGEKRYICKDQTIQWVQITSAITWNDDNTPKYFISVVQDIAGRKRAEEELLRVNRTLSVISSVNQAIIRIRDLQTLFESACHTAVDKGGFRMAWIGLLDTETSQVNPVAWAGIGEDYINNLNITVMDEPRGHGPTATTLRTGQDVIVQDINSDPRMAPWRDAAIQVGYRSSAAFPLKVGGKARGVLNLYAVQPHFFTEYEIALLDEMSADISFAMEYSEQETQRKLAETKLQEAERFAHSTVDSLSALITILDEQGVVLSLNEAWSRFIQNPKSERPSLKVGDNYLRRLETLEFEHGDASVSKDLLAGIHRVLSGEIDEFSIELPYPTADKKYWFMCRVTRFIGNNRTRIVIAYEDVTERVLTAQLLDREKLLLNERLKEMNCLYSHAKLIEQSDISLEALCQQTVDLMPPAWQYPQITCARLTIEGRSYTTSNFNETIWHQASEIHVGKQYLGRLEVYYLEDKPIEAEGPFLAEERLLIDELARRLGQKIEALQAASALQRAYDTLEEKVIRRTAQLMEAKERVEAILNNSVDGILLAESDLTIRQVNVSFNRLFACEVDRYLNQPLTALLAPESSESTIKSIQARLIADQNIFQEVRARRRDGTLFDAEISIGHIKGDGLVCVIRDVSERKNAEKALAEERNLLRTVIDTVPDLIYLSDTQSRIILNNTANAQAWGYDNPRDNVGKTPADVFSPELATKFMANDRQVVETKTPLINFEGRTLAPDRSEVWSLTTKVPFYSVDGELRGIAGVTRDITVQKQAEEALRQALTKEKELGELKTRFISMASHEFRTPLATILAMTESLSIFRHRLSADQIQTKLNNIRGQVDHLKDIMEDVLLLARMEARRVEFNPVIGNLHRLCQEVLEDFQSRPDVHHQVEYLCEQTTIETTLDVKLMRQIISNLISNAIKYSPEEQPIQLLLRYEDTACELVVRDHGIGIPEADLKHLFEPFHRASNVGTISGTGLGLVIVKDSVELHGGTISVESQLGKGSTFIIRIPISGQ